MGVDKKYGGRSIKSDDQQEDFEEIHRVHLWVGRYEG